MKLRQLFFLALVFLFVHSLQAQTADDIISNYFKNSGGLEKRKAIKTKISIGQMLMSMHGGSGPMSTVDVSIYEKNPSMQKIVTKFPTFEMVQSYDGKDAWMFNPMMGGKDPVMMDENQSKQLRNYEFESNFIDYQKKGHEVTYMGTEEVDGVKCFKIEMIKNKNNPKDDVMEIHYFESETYLPLMMVSYLTSGPNKGLESKTYFGDYQDVSGVTFPFSKETKVKGQTTQKITFQSIAINQLIEDAVFNYPKK